MSFPVVFVYLFNAEEVRELLLLCAYLFFFPSKKKKRLIFQSIQNLPKQNKIFLNFFEFYLQSLIYANQIV